MVSSVGSRSRDGWLLGQGKPASWPHGGRGGAREGMKSEGGQRRREMGNGEILVPSSHRMRVRTQQAWYVHENDSGEREAG